MINILIAGVLPVLLSVINYKWFEPEWWKEAKTSWKSTNIIATLSAIIIGVVASFVVAEGSDPRVLPVVLLTWLGAITIISDYQTYKIPKRATQLTYIPAVISIIWATLYTSSFSPLIAVGITLVLPLILTFMSGIGFGDVRLFFLFALTTSWWFTVYDWLTKALLISLVVGFVSILIANLVKKGKVINYTKGKIIHFFVRSYPVKEVRRRLIPFGPALIIGYLGYGLYLLFTHIPMPDNAILVN